MSYDELNDVALEMFHNKYDKLNSLMSTNYLEFFLVLNLDWNAVVVVVVVVVDDDDDVVLHDEHEYDELIHL